MLAGAVVVAAWEGAGKLLNGSQHCGSRRLVESFNQVLSDQNDYS